MKQATVYFKQVTDGKADNVASAARLLLETIIKDNNIKLQTNILLKIHPGQPGNTSYIKPDNYEGIISYLKENNLSPSYTETGMVTGPRSKADIHRKVAKEHGFTQIPFVIADGENGDEHIQIPIVNGKHFKEAKIAKLLANEKQVIVLSHFKGHVDAGFGAALKMLGIGFASRIGKMEQHSNDIEYHRKLGTINWDEGDKLYHGKLFCERVAEYAQAATSGKEYIYLNFALNLVTDCDCDGVPLKPIYKDFGVFASTDPVAIDKACYDLLAKREGKEPFLHNDIFSYAEKIGVGSIGYQLVEI